MEDITKDLLNTILYEETGEKSEFHNTILEGIKPYLKQNIQLGGGISLTIDNDDITYLFDNNGNLKTQYGAGLAKYIKRYANITFFNRFYSKYTKLMNDFDPLANDINTLHSLIDRYAGVIKGKLGEYYADKKKLVHLNYIIKKTPTSDTRNIEQLKRNIKDLTSHSIGMITKLNTTYAEFKKEYGKQKFKLLKLHKVNVDKYNVLKDDFNKLNKKITDMHILFDKKYSKLSAEIDVIRVKNEKIYTNINKKFNGFEEYRINIINKMNRLSDKLGQIENVKVYVDKRFNNLGQFDVSIGNMIDVELTNVYNKFDELIVVLKGMTDNFNDLQTGVLEKLQQAFTDFFQEQLKENKYNKKITDFIEKVRRCNIISKALFKQFLEIKATYATKDFPPPNLDNDFNSASHAYKGILAYFDEIKDVFSSFIQKTTGKVIIDNTTVVQFIKKINGLQSGGNSGKLIQYGGANIDNTIYYLHTYDMYAINGANGDDIGRTNNYLRQLTYLRRPLGLLNGLNKEIKYNTSLLTDILYNNLPPGVVMISKEIEYMFTHNIISKFVNNIKKVLNKPRPQFLGLLYKGDVYIYIVNILANGSLKIILYRKNEVGKIAKSDRFTVKVGTEDYIGYIPKNIRELHSIKVDKVKGSNEEETKKKQLEIKKLQSKVYMIPFFIKLGELDYAESLRHVKPGNQKPDGLYKYTTYLPIDTLFNKVLIPYVPVNIKDYSVFRKTSNDYDMTTLFGNTFNSTITNINLFSLNPNELLKLRNYKYILFFTDTNMKMFDNSSGPGRFIDIDGTLKGKINNVYSDYFNYFQEYNNKLKITNNIGNISREKLSFENIDIVNFLGGSIDKNNLREYYNSAKFEKYVMFFRFVYYKMILNIDIDILKFDKIEGIEDLKITSGPGNSLEKYIFTQLIDMKERLTDNLTVFEGLYEKIYKDDKIKKYIQSILHSFEKLATINDKQINFKIKEKLQVIPELVDAAEFYKSQDNNPDYPELESTKNIKFMIQTFTKDGGFKPGTGSSSNIMFSIYPAMEQIDDLQKEAKLKELTGKKDSIRQYDATKSYGALYKMLDTLITKEGAEQLIKEIKFFNQNKKDYKDGLYKNTSVSVNTLNKIYNNEGDKTGKPFYKLDFYIRTQLINNSEKLEIYKKGAQPMYKAEYEPYEKKLDEDIKIAEEKQENRKNRGYYNPNQQSS